MYTMCSDNIVILSGISQLLICCNIEWHDIVILSGILSYLPRLKFLFGELVAINCLPTRLQLLSRGVSCQSSCAFCTISDKDSFHLFFECDKSVGNILVFGPPSFSLLILLLVLLQLFLPLYNILMPSKIKCFG